LAPAPVGTGVPSAAEAAVRWRLGAARIDTVIVYGAYLVLCAVAHWRVTSPDHLLVLGVGSVAYHFVLESRDGQTLGKRRYGIRVVDVDGGPAAQKAILVRSVLRIIDQLPVWYASGLVSMIRTGPPAAHRRPGGANGRRGGRWPGCAQRNPVVVSPPRHAGGRGRVCGAGDNGAQRAQRAAQLDPARGVRDRVRDQRHGVAVPMPAHATAGGRL
jgi:hypothetical protein